MNDMKKKIMTMAMMALAFTACTEEDLMQPTQGDAGTLHIASVTIDGQEVARSRVVADGGTYAMNELPYNQSINGFIKGDALQLTMTNITLSSAYSIYNGTTWTLTSDNVGTNPVTIQPAEGKKWADVGIEAAFGGNQLSGNSNDYTTTAAAMDVVQGDIDVSNSLILGDWLVASTGNGATIDKDVKSPTLGATTIALKHAHALLRLPKSAAGIEEGTYIVNGTAHNVTDLGTLWAVVKNGNIIQYFPLTEVGDNLQAIVPADTEGIYTLTGFKAVMNTNKTVTLDLPFKVGEATTASTGIALEPNHQYPLTLNIAPHTASVSLSGGLGKPGWGDTENELSNILNERGDARFIPHPNSKGDMDNEALPGTFEVYTPKGLILVSQWMNSENEGVAIKSIEKVPNLSAIEANSGLTLNKDSLRLIHNISIENDLDFTNVEKTVTVGSYSAHMRPIGEVYEYNDNEYFPETYWGTGLIANVEGNDHTIKGLTIASQQSYAGMLAHVGGNDFFNAPQTGSIRNLTFDGGEIGLSVIGKAINFFRAGMAAGELRNGEISNVKTTGEIRIFTNTEEDIRMIDAGAIAGSCNGGVMLDCTNQADLSVEGELTKDSYYGGSLYVGGIVGYANSYVYYCKNKGGVASYVTNPSEIDSYYVGGIVGCAWGYWSVVASVNFGTSLTKTATEGAIGGIAGTVSNSSGCIYGCYTDSNNGTWKVTGIDEDIQGSYAVSSASDFTEAMVTEMNTAINGYFESHEETAAKNWKFVSDDWPTWTPVSVAP